MLALLDEVSENFAVEPEVVLADAGYCNEADSVGLDRAQLLRTVWTAWLN